jgi:DNA-binding transcriptional regulator YdaS (Cro superfamily)
MKLRIYLFTHKITINQFAEKLGIHRTYLGSICKGLRKPSRLLAKEIERQTNGEITSDDLLNFSS